MKVQFIGNDDIVVFENTVQIKGSTILRMVQFVSNMNIANEKDNGEYTMHKLEANSIYNEILKINPDL